MTEERVQTTFRVDADLLRQFQRAIAERDRKMTPVIEQLIRGWLGKQQAGEVNLPIEVEVSQEILDQFPELREAVAEAGAPVKKLRLIVEEDKPVGTTGRFDWDSTAQLNPRYTFDAFVIGSGNQFAHAACQAVAERPSKAYNPLFLYGGVGLGKTHLMHAIGHEIRRRQPRMEICYVSSEKFTNDMINSLRQDRMASFRDKYRGANVLLMDDVQFLAGKERAQEEFFHTFNALYESSSQIVVSSDCPPRELEGIEARLRSRFEWGLIADIQPPDLATRIAILQKKAEQEKVSLPPDAAEYIASSVRTNVREMEGSLVRLMAYSSLTGSPINLENARQVLKNLIDSQARKVTIESIQRKVAEQFGLRLVELKAKNNSRAIVYPRQIAMYLAKRLTEASLPEIGRQFGGKHATTVLHSIDKVEEVRRKDKDLNRLLNKLTEQLGE
jgi:chromosomal replication initiator protein